MPKIKIVYRIQDAPVPLPGDSIDSIRWPVTADFDLSDKYYDLCYSDWDVYTAPYCFRSFDGAGHLVDYWYDDDTHSGGTIKDVPESMLIRGASGVRQFVKVPIRKGIKKLTLSYDNEGGPVIFVSARTTDGAVIKPAERPHIDGTDPHFPLAKVVINEKDPASKQPPAAADPKAYQVPPSDFAWIKDKDATGAEPPQQAGCWSTEKLPGGSFHLYAKQTLDTGYTFAYFEFASFNIDFGPPLFPDDPSTLFKWWTSQVFAYLIVYYNPPKRQVIEPKTRPKIPKEEWVQEIARGVVQIYGASRGIAFRLPDLRAGLVAPRPRSPGAAGPQAAAPGPTVAPDLRRRIVEAARRFPNDDGDLGRLLDAVGR